MIVKTTLEERGPITQEEIEMLERASKMPIVYDEDSPELTAEELRKFCRVSDENRQDEANRRQQCSCHRSQKIDDDCAEILLDFTA